jgi:hypothetical protein
VTGVDLMDGMVERVLSWEVAEREWGGVDCDRWDGAAVSTTAPKVVFSSADIFTVIESADDSERRAVDNREVVEKRVP